MGMDAPWRALEAAEETTGAAAPGRWRPSPRHLMLAAVALLAAGSLAAVAVVEMRPGGQVEVIAGPSGTAEVGASPSPALVVVQVAGAVSRPGVYSLPAGSRVADAIAAAGGYSTDVDPRAAESKLNLAARLEDAQLIAVPRRGDTSDGISGGSSGAASGAGASAAAAGLINLNTASAADLDTLPGVGPATAAKIIASREEMPFASVDDLVARKVVTPATLDKFRDRVTV
jgi:competence protein ComEA